MTGSSPVESQQRVVSEALAALDALRPLLAGPAMDAALRRAHDWSLESTSTAGGPRGKGSHSDPCASAALNRIDDEGLAFRLLMSTLETIEQACSDAVRIEKTLRAVTGSAAYQKHLALTGTEANRARDCAQDSCPDPAITGSPHCAACAAYLAARPGTACVPSEVLEAREKKRTQRKAKGVHVTGPLAEQEAS